MKIADAKTKLTPGTNFTFTLPGNVTRLVVDKNDGSTLQAKVSGGPKDGQIMVWSLDGLEEVHGLGF